jgi:hypothetical protein
MNQSTARAGTADPPSRLRSGCARPCAGTTMTESYVQMIARMAYVWGWPLVNSPNRRAAFAKPPEPGLNGGVLPMAISTQIRSSQHCVRV